MAYRRFCARAERAAGFGAAFEDPRRAAAGFAFPAAAAGLRRVAAAAGRRAAGAGRLREAAGRAGAALAGFGAAFGSSAGPVRCTRVKRIWSPNAL